MNRIFSRSPEVHAAARAALPKLALSFGFLVCGLCLMALRLDAQSAGDTNTEFKQIVQRLSAARLRGTGENEVEMEKALQFLDSIALSILNVSAPPDLDTANKRLAGLVSHSPPVGENYRLVKLGGTSTAYAMVINFGIGGPAAVRIYAGAGGNYVLSARIDHFTQKDLFDSDFELVPASRSEPVFVTVAGRTDDLSTGIFSAWLFDGHRAVSLWSSELLQQSNYEMDENGFHLGYCSQADEDHPSQCLKMSRDVYRFQSGEWKRIETADLPPPKPVSK